MQVELAYSRFFEAKLNSPEVDDVIHECVTRQLPLQLTLGPASVALSSDPKVQESGVFQITGRWRSPQLEGRYSSTGALLLLPFVFHIEGLYLPYGSLYTLGRANRSVADLFMRNLFFAACRREQIIFHKTAGNKTSSITEGSRGLVRTYLWVARGSLEESLFKRNNAPELVVACAYLPLIKFSNPLIEVGAADMRLVSAQTGRNDALIEHKLAFLEARKRMLASYRT